MTFTLTAEQQLSAADREERVRVAFRETVDGNDRQNWLAAGKLGLLGLCIPIDFGGGGLGALDTSVALEAFGAGCHDTGFAFAVSAHLLACALPIATYGCEELKSEFLPGLCAGRLVAANAMTELAAGSDSSALQSRAHPAPGGDFVLDGEKSFASNAPVADVLVTYAVNDPKAGHLGLSAFAIPRSLKGISCGPAFAKMGLTSCPAGAVSFESVPVAQRYVLGSPGQGAAIFQHSMQWERCCLFAIYLGMMKRQIQMVVDHVRQRRQFGRKISDFQAVSHRVVDMLQRRDAARLMLFHAASLIDSGQRADGAVAQAKLAVSEAAVANSIQALQLLGGQGYLTGSGVEQQLRDSIPATTFSGTSEIQRELIAKGVGL